MTVTVIRRSDLDFRRLTDWHHSHLWQMLREARLLGNRESRDPATGEDRASGRLWGKFDQSWAISKRERWAGRCWCSLVHRVEILKEKTAVRASWRLGSGAQDSRQLEIKNSGSDLTSIACNPQEFGQYTESFRRASDRLLLGKNRVITIFEHLPRNLYVHSRRDLCHLELMKTHSALNERFLGHSEIAKLPLAIKSCDYRSKSPSPLPDWNNPWRGGEGFFSHFFLSH